MPCSRNHIATGAFSLLIVMPLLLITGLQGWQLYLKHQWKERLEREAAQTLVVPVAAVVWEKQDRELIVDGKLFDIFSYYIEDNFLIATGVFDALETRLEMFLASQYSRSPQNLSIIQLLFILQCFAVFITWRFSAAYARIVVTSFFSSFLNSYSDPFAGSTTPPPRPHFYKLA